ncbi:hypothetical protein [Pseudobutyrivibrio xylanivorans]|uniref:Uncharacterized protein n=1 Tax=Pseudobutyrivibrio xylanivorans DSM 14809 TaxID=1123012 RepID=A0A1M6IF66_PSEXY|nr:hypothetical protein [Pseudobutyrivibrio xylanivorans]SHJ33092.1 hypothetical protein SAMN02745725_02300 [Pseudobutyrivibrio xylanivorans DSM 14809]
MKFNKKLLTISVIFSMLVLRNPLTVFAEEDAPEDVMEEVVTDAMDEAITEDNSDENDIIEDTNISEELLDETESSLEGTDDEEIIEKIEEEIIEEDEDDEEDEHEPREASISIRGFVPTIVVTSEGYLSEKYCLCYESSFNAYDELNINEAITLLIDSDNKFSNAEKSALNSLNISGICPEDLSIDVYYNQNESEVNKINANYTLVDDDENETKMNVTLYEKDIK